MESFEYGDIMVAINCNGDVAGAQQYTGNGIAMQIYGEDLAHGIPGYVVGEEISLKQYRPSTDETFTIEYNVSDDAERNFMPFNITRILSTKSSEGISDISTPIKVYPNPTRGISRISGEAIKRIQVLNSIGAVLLDYTLPTAESHYNLDLSNYAKGAYIVQVTTKHGITSLKLIKM